jgi:predicted transcriptional regulator
MTSAQRRRQVRARQAAELRAKGFSLRDIAAYLGVSHDTVWKDLKAREVSAKKLTAGVRNLTPEADSNIVQLRREAQ